jgi:hypothetical protein
MTITTERVERPAPAPRVAIIALARAEAGRLLHSPLLWGAMVLSTGLGVAWTWTRMPSWEKFHENAGMASMVLAAALVVACQLAAGRDGRAGAEESARTLPAGPARRSLGLLAVIPVAALAGAVVYAAELLLLLPTWPVGRFVPWAAMVAAVLPAIGAAVGVVIGRFISAAAAGPLAVVALFVLLALPMIFGSVGLPVWPVSLVTWDFGFPYPHGWHLLYLLGLLATATAAVSWPAAPKVSAAVGVVAVLFAGFSVQREAAITPDVIFVDEAMQRITPERLDCQVHAEVRYCALPGYGSWNRYWREAVEPVAELLPPTARKPSVRQIARMDDLKPMTPGYPELVVGEVWGRIGGWAEDSRQAMTRDYVMASVGLLRREAPWHLRYCDASGQHRTVAALWLAAQAAPGEGLALPRVRYGPAEIQAAESLLARPKDEVAAYLAGHWPEILDPSATGLAGLGVTIVPPPVPTGPPAEPSGSAVPTDAGVCR